MYCWPLTQMLSDLPLGGSFLVGPEAKSVPLSASCSPFGPEFGGLRMLVELDEGEGGQDDEDERGADRPADLQARVAADLGRHEPLARAELDQRVEEGALDADEDDDRDGEDQLVERVDLVGVGRAPALGRERIGESGAGEGQQRGQGDEDGEGEAARTSGGRGPGPGQGARIVFTGRRTTVRRWRDYRPPNAGGRFWMKAATPSAKSGEPTISCWTSASSSSCSSMRA